VQGTENVVRAAKDAGVRRVVHTSSNATIGYSRDGKPLDESSRNTDQRSSPYIDAKCRAEDAALGLGKALGIEVVAVCPCGILGPWDYRQTPTTRAAASMGNGGPSVLALAVTHASDVASAHRLAAEKGRPGERYLASGENLSTEQVAALVNDVTGSGCRAMAVPIPVLWLLAVGQELGSRFTGRDPDLTRAALRDVGGCSLFYDSRRAREELGWSPRSAADAMADTFRWLAWLGALKPAIAERVAARFPADPSWVK
jgi:dihydroflavonol-4-reductase